MYTPKLQKSSLAKDTLEFVSFFIYELKSQSNSIIAHATLLNDELDFDKHDPRVKTLNNIVSAACDIHAQLKRLLEVAKLETSGFQLDLETVDITSLITEAVDKMSPIVRLKNQSISTKLITPLPNINGDSLRIEQVLTNLISNKSISTPDGGHIYLIAGLHGESIFIRIQDGGPIKPVELHQYIFQPLNNTVTLNKDSDKVDLNLALCKHYVELHGGKLEIENIGNKSNTFSVILPAA